MSSVDLQHFVSLSQWYINYLEVGFGKDVRRNSKQTSYSEYKTLGVSIPKSLDLQYSVSAEDNLVSRNLVMNCRKSD